MTWLFFGLLCACGESLKDLFSKRGLKNINPVAVSWLLILVTTAFSSPLILIDGIPDLSASYWGWLLLHGLIYGSTVIIYMHAINISDISLCVPMVMFSPLFMLITGPLILGEFPNGIGLIGVLLIVIGSYMLNVNSLHLGLAAPFKALLNQPGPRWMLLVSFLWAITAPIDKLGIAASSPIFWGVTLHVFISVWMLPVVLLTGAFKPKLLVSQWRNLIPAGLFNAAQLYGYVFAMSLGFAVYVLSVKRLSVLLVVLFGHFFFGESGLKERLGGAVIMLCGVLLIAFGS